MKLFKNSYGQRHRINFKRAALTAATFVAIVTLGFVGMSTYTNSKAEAGDCSPNSIIKCGSGSRAVFINQVKQSPELQKIYAHFGLTSADYSRFVSSARPGVAYRSNNTIVVDGRVVANDVWSIGRFASYQGSGYKTVVIPGAGTYYGNYNDKAFAAGAAAIPVDVLFDSQGKMQFAVMTEACGNPATGTPTVPNFTCQSLNPKSLGNNQWSFTTSASAGNGASIAKLVYDFGDGSAPVTTTNPATVVKHTFTKTSNVTVNVYINLPGGGTTVLSNCTHKITYTPPPAVYACTSLTATPGNKADSHGNVTYTLVASASATNATIKSYGFDFDDGSSPATVTTSNKTAQTSHIYAPGNFTAKVSVTVLTNTGETKQVTSPSCAAPIIVKTPECKPGIPVGDSRCSTLACTGLTIIPGNVDSNGNQSFTLNAAASTDNATIVSYDFALGDGSPAAIVTTTKSTASTTHVYKPGAWTASVSVNGKDASGKALQATSVDCSRQINVGQSTTPAVTITKTVDGLKSEQVSVGQNFIYQLVVKNTGTQDLADVAVTDATPAGVTLISTSPGSIANNTWSYTIPSLAVGASVTVNITAVVNTYVPGSLVNTACVDAPAVNHSQPNKPDACDTATVTVDQPNQPQVLPATLVNTGPGSVAGIFAAAAAIGTIGYRVFLARRLSRDS